MNSHVTHLVLDVRIHSISALVTACLSSDRHAHGQIVVVFCSVTIQIDYIYTSVCLYFMIGYRRENTEEFIHLPEEMDEPDRGPVGGRYSNVMCVIYVCMSVCVCSI